MVISHANMSTGGTTFQYALGSTDAEHERLIRQADLLALSPNDSSDRRALAPVSVCWSLVPALETWRCWLPDLLVLQEKW
jgi:hypothetical protein